MANRAAPEGPAAGDPQPPNSSRALLAPLAALAAGDADREEVVASLRRDGVDALDVLVALFANDSQPRRTSATRIDVQNLGRRSPDNLPPKRLGPSTRPFLHRGTLYDPADITRLEDRQLHFVNTAEEHLLVIDDRSIMENWWQTSYLTSAARGSGRAAADDSGFAFLGPDGSPSVATTRRFGPDATTTVTTSWPDRRGPRICGDWVTVPAPGPIEHTNFYEHPGYEGDRLELEAGQGEISDLTNECKGFLCCDDWNDRIDSIELVRTEVAVLFEHVGCQGQTWTTTQNARQVDWFNDLTSSVRTWGSTPWHGTMRVFKQRPCYPGEAGR